MILDEAGLRALIEEAVRKVVREERAPGLSASDQYVSVAEAARRIDVAPATIRQWVQERRLGRYHAGRELRIRLSELQALVARPEQVSQPTPEEAARDFLARRASGGVGR